MINSAVILNVDNTVFHQEAFEDEARWNALKAGVQQGQTIQRLADPTFPPVGKTVDSVTGVYRDKTKEEKLSSSEITQADYNAETIVEYEARVQMLLDTTAQKKGYDSALSCVSYAGGTSSFATEGAAMKTWRDSVWAYCYQQAALLPTATPPIPTADQFIASLLASCPAPW